ncbi:Spy/CpxP family protein refolding chaperone [candidate division KSB1 bacterium]
MRKLTLFGIALMLMVSTTVYAQRARQGIRQRQAVRQAVELTEEQKALIEQAKLTTEQQERIKELRIESQKKRIGIQADLKIAQIELNELRSDVNVSESSVKSQLEKTKSYEVDLQMENFRLNKEVNAIYTPEQKEAREKLKAQVQKLRRRGAAVGRTVNRGRGVGRQAVRRNSDRSNTGRMQGRAFRRGIGRDDNMPMFRRGEMPAQGDNSMPLHEKGFLRNSTGDDEWLADINWLFDKGSVKKPEKKNEKEYK